MSMLLSAWTMAAKMAEDDTEFDPAIVSPGTQGFLFTALFALAVIGLGIILVRRLRRNQYRHEAREQIEQELAEMAERDAAANGEANDAGGADETPADPSPEK